MRKNIKTMTEAANFYNANKNGLRVYCGKCKSRKYLKYCDPTLFIATYGKMVECSDCSPDLLSVPIPHVKRMMEEAREFYQSNKDDVRKYCAIHDCTAANGDLNRARRLLRNMDEEIYSKTRGDVTICESCVKTHKIINIPKDTQSSLLRDQHMVCKSCGREKPFYEFPSTDSKILVKQGFATETGLLHYCKDCIDGYDFKYDVYKNLYKPCSGCGSPGSIYEYIDNMEKISRVIKKKVLDEDGNLVLVPVKDYEGVKPDFVYVADIACVVCKTMR